jgi:hypothetical protein
LAYSTDHCLYSYDIQPGPLVKSFNQSLENGTHLTLCCQVSSEETTFANFSIQWHYSSIYPLPSNKESDIKDTIILQANQTIIWKIDIKKSLVWSKLTTHIQEEKDTGFYWCSVNNGTFIPSTVLNISSLEDVQLQTCNCDDKPILDHSLDSILFSKFPCAYGNISEMEPQSDECKKADQDKLSPSTNTVEDLMTTAAYEIDTDNGTTQSETNTDNGSTTGEGTAESLFSFIAIATAAILSLILLLCLMIGICLRKLSKMRRKHPKQQAEHVITISTPIDVYNMTTKTKLVCKESALSPSFMCEPNTSYDTTPGTTTAPSLDHVYDCIP